MCTLHLGWVIGRAGKFGTTPLRGVAAMKFQVLLPEIHTWSTKSRGICLVTTMRVDLVRPDGEKLKCEDYDGCTSYSQFFIIMKGDNACCVQSSSHESGVCP